MVKVIDKEKGIYEVYCRKCRSLFDLNINDINNHTITCPWCHEEIIIILCNHPVEQGYHNWGILYVCNK